MRKSHSRACARVWNYGRSYNSPDTVVRDRTSIAQPYACVVYLSSVWYVVRAYIRRIYAVSVYYVYPRAVLYICVGNKIRMYVCTHTVCNAVRLLYACATLLKRFLMNIASKYRKFTINHIYVGDEA